MDISRSIPHSLNCMKKLTFVSLITIMIFHILRLQFICIEPDLDSIEDRNLRKIIMLGKNLEDERTCRKEIPKCIIVGVIKGGTEAFSTFLALHPQVAMQFKAKPTLYFTDINYKKGKSWYKNQMPCSKHGQITIEKSPQYWGWNDAPSRIHLFYPTMKVILVVRDPVSRAISHYLKQIYSNPDELQGKTFEEMITDGNGEINTKSRILQLSAYAPILKQWLRHFKQNQILIVDGNNLNKNPVMELRRAERFLNLTSYINRDMFVKNTERDLYCIKSKCGKEYCLPESKSSGHPDIDEQVLEKLKKYFDPLNEEFFKITGRKFVW